ncbi:MAG TPA: hybrid sensor histidine kinase/response regulator [Candidatus Angelobacter sp.]|nr:hybrid sensor histidine kinase/response regulator [Candidatus Angelobacter sp.]
MSFRAKVLVPVIAVMVCLLAVTAWVVDHRITKQFEIDAARNLVQADEGFRAWQKNRNKNLIDRVIALRDEPLFHAIMQTDFLTIKEDLVQLRSAAGTDVKIISYTTGKQGQVAISAENPLIPKSDFEAASALATKGALHGENKADTIHVGDELYEVVAIPAYDVKGDLSGAFSFAMEIGKDTVADTQPFTRSEIVLLADNQVIVHTPSAPSSVQRLVNLFKELAVGPQEAALRPQKAMFDGKHYYCSARRIQTLNPDSSIGYLLLYSYEDSWEALQTTKQLLIAANAVAILLGAIIVCFLVGRVTQPLRELRDSAEAVGRGDFSRWVEVRYDDECGELARVFNQMTQNLKNSREQLEMTVDTLKTTQAQLIQSEKLSGIGEFIAGVAHELNNPLTSVMGFSELLQKNGCDPKHKRYLEMIHKSSQRCHKIVQSLLGFARRSAPERKAVSLNVLVEGAVEILQYQLRTSNVEIISQLDPELPQTLADPHQVQQVLINLINNARQAIEAHQPKGWIKITSARHEDMVRVTIQDNGPGIPEQNLSKIFDPFFTTKEVGKGTGLGLSLCYGIIKDHGGTITPRSRPGEGASFTIELPVTDQPAEAIDNPPEHESDVADGKEGAGKRVLVIDDEEPILQMVREALTPRGYEVDIAADGATGLQRMSEKEYDVALCDWKMPGLTGQQVYERVRAVNPALSSRMIFITGDVVNERTQKFLEQQNKICLAKPFTISEFRAAIKQVLATESSHTNGKNGSH